MFLSKRLIAIGDAALQFEFQGNADIETNLTTYTFSNMALGPATNNRRVLIGISYGNNADVLLSSITVAGEPATILVNNPVPSATVAHAGSAWCIADLSSSSSTIGDIAVTMSAAGGRCGISVYSLDTGGIPELYDSAIDGDVPSLTLSVNTPPGDSVVLGCVYASSTPTFAWTGITEDHESLIVGSTERYYGSASDIATAEEIPRTVILDVSSGTYECAAVIVMQ